MDTNINENAAGQAALQPADKKSAKKTLSRIGFFYLLGIIIIYAVAYGLGMLFGDSAAAENPDISLFLFSVLPMYAVGFPIVIFLMKKVLPAEKLPVKKLKTGEILIYGLICLGLAYSANFCGLILTYIIGMLIGNPVSNTIIEVASSISPWAVLIYMVLMAPVMEEYLFRKLIIDRTVKYGKVLSILLSGLMFGLYHGNLNQFIYAFVIGCFFAFLYVRTGNIKVSIGMHMLFNFLGGFLASNLLKLLHLDEVINQMQTASDSEVMMKLFANNAVGFVLYLIFIMFVFGVIIGGIVMFIVYIVKGKFKVTESEQAIPKKQRGSVLFLNPGMLIYVIFWTAVIVLQLFGTDRILSLIENAM